MAILLEHNLSYFRRVSLGLLAVVLIGILVIQGCTPSSQSITNNGQEATAGMNVGEPVPDFALVDLEGNQISPGDFRGKTVFVNFWATWCPPCRAEMPEIEAIHQEYKDKDVVVIGIAIMEPEDVVRQYVEQGSYSWTFVIDDSGKVASDYRVTVIPTSFFIDQAGIIQAATIGGMAKQVMENKLAEAMR